MASRILSSNFRLCSTEKLWLFSSYLIKKGSKLNLFLPAFFYYFFYYQSFFILQFFLYKLSAYFQFDFFLLRNLKKFYFFKTRLVRTPTRYVFRRFSLYKRRRPTSGFAKVFSHRSLGGYFSNLGRLRVLNRSFRRRLYLKNKGKLVFSAFVRSFKNLQFPTRPNSWSRSSFRDKNLLFFVLRSSSSFRKKQFLKFFSLPATRQRFSLPISALNYFFSIRNKHYLQGKNLKSSFFYKWYIYSKLSKKDKRFLRIVRKTFLQTTANTAVLRKLQLPSSIEKNIKWLTRIRQIRNLKVRFKFLWRGKKKKFLVRSGGIYKIRRLLGGGAARTTYAKRYLSADEKTALTFYHYSPDSKLTLQLDRTQQKYCRRRLRRRLRRSLRRTLSIFKSLTQRWIWRKYISLSYKYAAGQFFIKQFNSQHSRKKTFSRFLRTFFRFGRRRFRFFPFKQIVKFIPRKYDHITFSWILRQPKWSRDGYFFRPPSRVKRMRYNRFFYKLFNYYSIPVFNFFCNLKSFSVRRKIKSFLLRSVRLKFILLLQLNALRHEHLISPNILRSTYTDLSTSSVLNKMYLIQYFKLQSVFNSTCTVVNQQHFLDTFSRTKLKYLLGSKGNFFASSIVKSYNWKKRVLFYPVKKKIYKCYKLYLQKKFFFFFLSLRLTAFLNIVTRVKVFSVLSFLNRSWYSHYKKMVLGTLSIMKLKPFEHPWLKKFLLIFLVGFKFQNFRLFLSQLTQFFHKLSRHQYISRRFFKALIRSSLFQLKRIIGFKLSIKGKMNRRPRAKLIQWFRNAKPNFQNLNVQILYSARQITTYFGSYMFRFWVYWAF